MTYCHLTQADRYTLSALQKEGYTPAAIARVLGRNRSTISRELKRNRCAVDGAYRPSKAQV